MAAVQKSCSSSSKSSQDRALSIFNFTGFIFEVGNKLRLPDDAIASASHMFQVFCERQRGDPAFYDKHLLAMAALHLAGKVHESIVNLGDVVNTAYSCIHRSKPPLQVCSAYWKLKDSLAQYELFLLRGLAFDMRVDLPHKYLLHFLLSLSFWVEGREWNGSKISQVCWSLLNDVFRSPLCLDHQPDFVAAAVLYVGVDAVGLKVESCGAERQWWEVFCPSCTEKDIQVFALELLSSYKQDSRQLDIT